MPAEEGSRKPRGGPWTTTAPATATNPATAPAPATSPTFVATSTVAPTAAAAAADVAHDTISDPSEKLPPAAVAAVTVPTVAVVASCSTATHAASRREGLCGRAPAGRVEAPTGVRRWSVAGAPPAMPPGQVVGETDGGTWGVSGRERIVK